MIRFLLAALIAVLGASDASAVQKPKGRFTKGKMVGETAFGARWGRGRTSVTKRADTPTPANFGTTAAVAGAKVQAIGYQTAPGGPFSNFGPDAGDRIKEDTGKSIAMDPGSRVFEGPKDSAPGSGSSSSSSGGASGANAVTPNAPLNTGTASGANAITPNTPAPANTAPPPIGN